VSSEGFGERIRSKVLLATVFLGPSMMIAIQMSGKSFEHFRDLGADYGLSLIIVALVALGFKFALVDGLARYTLYRKDSVFSGLPNVPGPTNWAVWAVTVIYTLELAIYSSLALEAGTSLSDLVSWSVPPEAIALVVISMILTFLLFRSRSVMERVVYAIIGTVTVLLAYCAVACVTNPESSWGSILFEELPVSVVFLAGSGSGLSLLLYSVWLSDKAKNVNSGDDYRTELSKVRWSLGLSFLMTGLITVLILIIGRTSSEAHSSLVASLVLVCTAVLMFGMVLVGMDGRARAIGKMLRQTGASRFKKELSYRVLVLTFFFIIVLFILLGSPSDALGMVSAVSSAMFALSGFALIYIDRKLPSYARGGRTWAVLTFVGSAFFLAVAMLEEETLLDVGVPLILRMALIGALLYWLWKFNILSWMVKNSKNAKGLAAMIAIFSLVSIFGTAAGISYGGVIINFRDLGPMIAGLLGGPIAGVLVGLVGGLYRYSIGGWSALPCFVATVSAGLVAGLLSMQWKGKISYLKVVILGILVECMHIFIYFPLLQQGGTSDMVLSTMREIFLPMTVVNVLGLIIYAYIIETWRSSRRPVTNVSAESAGAQHRDA